MPMIPMVKIKLSGNKGASQGLIKFATAQLSILERQMSYQKLNEGRRVVSPFKGVTVECISKFGRKEIRIHVEPNYIPYVPSYHEIQRVVRPVDEQIDDKQEHPEYFFRLKYKDPGVEPYEVIGGADHTQLNSDRIMVWEVDVPGKTVLLFDADVVNRVVHYPVGLAVEGEASILATADSYILTCPSNAVPAPVDCLEDFALTWFHTGGLSDPVADSVVCNFTPSEATYKIDDLYLCDDGLTEFCSMIPLYPTGIDDIQQDAWRATWCTSPLFNYDSESWIGIGIASSVIGDLNPRDYSPPSHIFTTKSWVFDLYGYPRYYFRAQSELSAAKSYMQTGTWFTNSSELTNFNCFFTYLYSTKSYSYDLQSIAPEDTEGNPGDAMAACELYQRSKLLGLSTPLEDIDISEIISAAYAGAGGCSECACEFQAFPYSFRLQSGGEGGIYNHFFTHPCAPICPNAGRGVTEEARRQKGKVHMATVNSDTGNINLVGLSHYVENRIVSAVWVNSYAHVCDGVDGAKPVSYADFGYIVYAFSPPAFSWVNPDTKVTEYWNIYDERVAEGIINPNRCLDIEEYVNVEINKLQIILDDDTGIEKMDATTGCAYPLAWYGYGITDGFILKP
jgi:hypothetical protein